jgi:hypothetical protein
MVTPQYILALCLLVMFLLVGVWDIYVQAKGEPENTVSNLLGVWSQNYPMLPMVMGILVGHLLWPRSVRPL